MTNKYPTGKIHHVSNFKYVLQISFCYINYTSYWKETAGCRIIYWIVFVINLFFFQRKQSPLQVVCSNNDTHWTLQKIYYNVNVFIVSMAIMRFVKLMFSLFVSSCFVTERIMCIFCQLTIYFIINKIGCRSLTLWICSQCLHLNYELKENF